MKDYIILRDYETGNGWCEIFLFDYELTNGDIDRINKAIQKVKDNNPAEYDNEDIEQAIDRIAHYTNSIIISHDDDYHTIWY